MDGKNNLNVTKAAAKCLNIIDDWIYYADKDLKGIYKVKTDGTEKTLIKEDVDPSVMQVTASGWIYYTDSQDDNKLYRIAESGDDPIPLPIKTVTGLEFNDAEVKSVTLSKTSANIVKGNVLQLTATVAPENSANKSITWSSSNNNIATVDPNGLVNAKEAGSVTITATSNNGKKGTCAVKVTSNEVLPTSIKLSKTSTTINLGGRIQLVPTISPSTATNKSVTWVSSNTSIANVSSTGVVTALKEGNATITAVSSNGKSANCVVTVQKKVDLITARFSVYNIGNKQISGLYMTTSDTTDYGTNLLGTSVVPANGLCDLSISFDKNTSYDIMVKYKDGTTCDYRGLSFATATAKGGGILLKDSSAELQPNIEFPLTIKNSTGKQLKELRNSTSYDTTWSSQLLEQPINGDGSTIVLNYLIPSFNNSWYFELLLDSTSVHLEDVKLGTLNATGVVLEITYNNVSGEYEYTIN